jgi:hypothetical protein
MPNYEAETVLTWWVPVCCRSLPSGLHSSDRTTFLLPSCKPSSSAQDRNCCHNDFPFISQQKPVLSQRWWQWSLYLIRWIVTSHSNALNRMKSSVSRHIITRLGWNKKILITHLFFSHHRLHSFRWTDDLSPHRYSIFHVTPFLPFCSSSYVSIFT